VRLEGTVPDELQHVVDLAGVAIVDPITDSWFQKIRLSPASGFGPVVAPQVTSRPPFAIDFSESG